MKMQTGENTAYEKFMQTGRVEDYLCYARAKETPVQRMDLTGMDGKGAYNNGCDRTAGAAH